jgi:hypothetical protein
MPSEVPRVPLAADLLSSVLTDAGLDKTSTINVTGKDGLAPLIWLCRHGFDHVAYVRSGPGCPRQAADALLVLHTTPLAELERLLAEPGQLREGGVLIIQTPDLRASDGRDPIHALLRRAGYRIERCIMRRNGELHVARRQNEPANWRRAA